MRGRAGRLRLVVVVSAAILVVAIMVVKGPASTWTGAWEGGSKLFLPLACRTVPTSGPAPYPTPAPLVLGGQSRLGVWMATEAGLVDALWQTGAKWTRVTVHWAEIEPQEAGSPVYDRYDSLFRRLGEAGITPIAAIQNNPDWAATTRCGPVDKKPERFVAFLQALVGRYKGPPYNVKHWELYNEPDNRAVVPWGDFLGGCFGDQPGKYVEMLQAATAAVKGVDPAGKVVYGGLAFGTYYDPNLGQEIFNGEFLAQTLDRGAGAYFDVANLHYFSEQAPFYSTYGEDIAGKVGAVRKIMSDRQVQKPVAITELSYTENTGAANYEELQARYVPKVLARGLAIDLYAMTWFLLGDWSGADKQYGLIDLSGERRPSFAAYQTAAVEFGDAETIRPLVPADVGGTGGVEGFVFTAAGRERWLIWARSGEQAVSLPTGAFEARDKLGQSIPVPTVVGESPVYVHISR